MEGEDARYAAVLNGGYNGLVRKTEVDALIELAPWTPTRRWPRSEPPLTKGPGML